MVTKTEAYLDGSLELEQDGLRDEDLASLGAQISNLGFKQLNLLARTAASHLEQAVNYRIEVDLVLVSHDRGIPWRGIARRYRRGGRRWRVRNESTGTQTDAQDGAAAGRLCDISWWSADTMHFKIWTKRGFSNSQSYDRACLTMADSGKSTGTTENRR
jgi:hypothetical protein